MVTANGHCLHTTMNHYLESLFTDFIFLHDGVVYRLFLNCDDFFLYILYPLKGLMGDIFKIKKESHILAKQGIFLVPSFLQSVPKCIVMY